MIGHRNSPRPRPRPALVVVDVVDVTNGLGAAFVTGPDPACHYTVRTSRRADGSLRIQVRRTVEL